MCYKYLENDTMYFQYTTSSSRIFTKLLENSFLLPQQMQFDQENQTTHNSPPISGIYSLHLMMNQPFSPTHIAQFLNP